MTDEQAMLSYQAGDESAFNVLFERHNGRVYSYIQKRVFAQKDQDEVFQEVFLKLHRSRHLYNSEHLFVKWLYVIMRSVLWDYFRRRKNVEEVSLTENIEMTTPATPAAAAIDFATLTKGLSPDQSLALKLRYEDGEDFQTIAEKLGKTEPAVRKLISRTIGLLKSRGKNEL